MAYRSEANRVPNKQYYEDLNLTHYPAKLDTRANNENMKGFVNVGEQAIPDYVMAEYVNAALDGVMALQRALGINPMVSTRAKTEEISHLIEHSTVSERIASIEGGDLDERYGGVGWKYVHGRPVLNNHNHDGLDGHPGKIHLQQEVESLLRKINIDLTLASGLTGSDIFISNTTAVSIADSVADLLSKTYGGTVLAKTNFNRGIRSLTTIEMVASEFSNYSETSLVTDNLANLRKTMQGLGTSSAVFHNETLGDTLLFGKYVLGVRVKTNSSANVPILRITTGEQSSTFNASEFSSPNEYQMLYHVFNYREPIDLTIAKIAGSNSTSLSVDSFFVHPIHPAVFDR